MSLHELIHQCRKENRNAQEQLYRLYAAKLFGLCLKYSENRQQAEDNLQDGFVQIFNKIKQFREEGSFEGWMKRVMVNTCLQKYRQQKVYSLSNEAQIEEEDPEVEEEEFEINFLLQCIQALPDRYRQVFSLYVLDGYSHREIAEMMNISEGTSKSNLARARMALKEKIEESRERQNSAQSS
ncbi:RNA polymerase subunit sigma-70 [Christiangramia fulva]|uniref:RNA polymerase subunit sigma-70 n=1 Tax=Christiangramia fulva TaxID=2126553 RepID=A0A2R3Z3P7_9FLAO|nr:RNA polymerase sigma factor [Christiangramia fulva]AVR44884.1 RNA polymerase subunit sigma-70 [Christiangramia fulva]